MQDFVARKIEREELRITKNSDLGLKEKVEKLGQLYAKEGVAKKAAWERATALISVFSTAVEVREQYEDAFWEAFRNGG